jgi:hypothetical protein
MNADDLGKDSIILGRDADLGKDAPDLARMLMIWTCMDTDDLGQDAGDLGWDAADLGKDANSLVMKLLISGRVLLI